MNQYKVFVGVNAKFEPDGTLTPVSVIWEDGRIFEIDKILDVRRAASLKAGGIGTRYTVRIGHRETFLFLEDGRWFTQRRD